VTQPQTFTAGSMAEAYEQVRSRLGPDALILSTQTFPRLAGAVEVEIVAIAAEPEAPHAALEDDLAAHNLVRSVAEAAASRRVRPANELPSPEVEEPAAPRTAEELLASIEERTRAIESGMRWVTASRARTVLDGAPPALREVYDTLVEHGVVPRFLESFLQRLEGQLRNDLSRREVMRAAERTLAVLLPPTPRLEVGHAGQVIFVVGPPSTDKTSAALRLAAEAPGGRRGIVASTDVDRAGAPQQFLATASAAGIEAHVCYTPSELRTVLRDAAADLVVVDCAPDGAVRTDRMLELKSFLRVSPRHDLLVALPASHNAAAAQRAVAAYMPLAPTGAVLTGVDEAAGFGGAISALLASTLGVAFTAASSTSEPLSTGDNHALAMAVLLGRWPAVVRDDATRERSGARVATR